MLQRAQKVGERVSIEGVGAALTQTEQRHDDGERVVDASGHSTRVSEVDRAVTDRDEEAVEFVRFCYRRRAVAWPELYDEMCAVAQRGDYRGMGYEQLERLGIGLALAALPRLAAMAARVAAEERGSAGMRSPAVS